MVKTRFANLKTPNGHWVSPEELHRVLADEGYSGPDRKTFLNSLLTELAAKSAKDAATGDGSQALLAEVRSILEAEQAKHGEDPVAKDNL